MFPICLVLWSFSWTLYKNTTKQKPGMDHIIILELEHLEGIEPSKCAKRIILEKDSLPPLN